MIKLSSFGVEVTPRSHDVRLRLQRTFNTVALDDSSRALSRNNKKRLCYLEATLKAIRSSALLWTD